jgi:hypothetical protein
LVCCWSPDFGDDAIDRQRDVDGEGDDKQSDQLQGEKSGPLEGDALAPFLSRKTVRVIQYALQGSGTLIIPQRNAIVTFKSKKNISIF